MSQLLDEGSTRLYWIRKTVMEMLRDRDYVVSEFELATTKEQFRVMYGDEARREDLVIQKSKRSNNTEHIFVFFPEEAKVGVKSIKTYVDRMKTENVHRALLVVQQNLTPFARQCVSEMSSKYHLEVFQENELLVNIKSHALVPQHEVLTPDEQKTLLERYTVKETQLPRMQENDPVAPYYGLKQGQVVGFKSQKWELSQLSPQLLNLSLHSNRGLNSS